MSDLVLRETGDPEGERGEVVQRYELVLDGEIIATLKHYVEYSLYEVPLVISASAPGVLRWEGVNA